MRFGSICSGIGCADLAFHRLGWGAAFMSEIEPFPRAVLRERFPQVPLHGDFTTIQAGDYEPIDLLVGGTPCQSFSVAGLRKGLADERGNLALEYLRLADRLRPRWLVWENVPGVLSSGGGRDFGSFLGGMGELGYGFAYRVLDAQHFGVAQRRRRVFVVGYLGDWRRAAAVLFEPASLRWHPAPSREAGEGTTLGSGVCAAVSSGHGWWDEAETGATLRAQDSITKADTLVARCVTTGEGRRQDAETCTLIAHSLRGEGFDASEDGTGRGTPLVPVAFDCKASGRNGFGVGEIASTQRAMGHSGSHTNGGGHQAVALGSAVRRLTPRECERLQGLPDDWTLIPWRKAMAPDGPRYKAIGNGMAVPCLEWIGRRISGVETQCLEVAA